MRSRPAWARRDGSDVQPDGFRVEVDERPDGIRVALHGELDLSTVVDLRRELRAIEALEPTLLVLDLRKLAFMDSMGLGVVIGAARRARLEGRRLVLIHGPRPIRSLLSITGVDRMLDTVDTPAAAGLH